MRLCFSRQVLKIPSVRVAHFAFEIALSLAAMLTLLLVCAFSPKVQKYLLGSPFPIKRREFVKYIPENAENLMNFWGSLQVLTRARTDVRNRVGFCKNAEKSLIFSVFYGVDGKRTF